MPQLRQRLLIVLQRAEEDQTLWYAARGRSYAVRGQRVTDLVWTERGCLLLLSGECKRETTTSLLLCTEHSDMYSQIASSQKAQMHVHHTQYLHTLYIDRSLFDTHTHTHR